MLQFLKDCLKNGGAEPRTYFDFLVSGQLKTGKIRNTEKDHAGCQEGSLSRPFPDTRSA
ncbi:hypothetical protein ACRRTK_002870 [Alexandromys fortis]